MSRVPYCDGKTNLVNNCTYKLACFCDCCMKVCMIELFYFFVYLSGEGGGKFGAGGIFFFFFFVLLCL